MSDVQQSLRRRRGVSLSLDIRESNTSLQRRESTASLPIMDNRDRRYHDLSPISAVAARLGDIGNAIDSELSESSLSLSLSVSTSTERRPSVASSVASTLVQNFSDRLKRRVRNFWRRVFGFVVPTAAAFAVAAM